MPHESRIALTFFDVRINCTENEILRMKSAFQMTVHIQQARTVRRAKHSDTGAHTFKCLKFICECREFWALRTHAWMFLRVHADALAIFTYN